MKIIRLTVIILLFTSCASKMDANVDKFQIVFECRPSDEVFLVLNALSIERIDWENQIYYLNEDSLSLFKFVPLGSNGTNAIFMYNSHEVYRANVISPYNSYPLYKDAAFISCFKEKGQIFKDNALSVTYLEYAKINKRQFRKAEKYLRKQGILAE